jgi:hypothetical protein
MMTSHILFKKKFSLSKKYRKCVHLFQSLHHENYRLGISTFNIKVKLLELPICDPLWFYLCLTKSEPSKVHQHF